MDRRALLRAAAGAGTLVAGCLEARDDPGDAGTAGGGGSPTGTTERSPAGTGSGGSGDDDGPATDGSPTDEPTDTGTPTDDDATTRTDEATETPEGSDGSNALVDRSFEVGSTECGQGANRADVTRGDDSVDVVGTIGGRNGCYTAELERATYDEGADELTVAVRSYEDSDGGYCQQCIVDVDYRASFQFREGTPGEVTVLHDGDHVTTE